MVRLYINKINTSNKLIWDSPVNLNVEYVEIYKATSKNGTYSLLESILATDSDKWITEYIDENGTSENWYKIRFKDSNDKYSEYSNIVSTSEEDNLSTIDDVKQYIDTVGRWSDEEVRKVIVNVDSLIYDEFGTPLQQIISTIEKKEDEDSPETLYYVGEQKILRIDRIFLGDDNLVELFQEQDYLVDLNKGIINISSYCTNYLSENCKNIDYGQTINIYYVPNIFSKLSAVRTAKRLIQTADLSSNGKSSKELKTIQERVDEIENILQNRYTLSTSEHLKNYDTIYGVNLKKIKQEFNKNNIYTDRW
jgi:hypothetical protein